MLFTVVRGGSMSNPKIKGLEENLEDQEEIDEFLSEIDESREKWKKEWEEKNKD